MSIKTLSPLYPSSGGSPGYEMYTVHDNGNMDTYMMQGTELNPRQPSPVFENFETMTNDTTSAYIVDPSSYYPTVDSYGYYCTGYESPGEWDEQHAVYGVDGTDGQYMAQGAQIENMPYLYYTPNYGYGESPFNPYNPYIPGAMVGVDGSCVGTQPYYVSPYSDNVSSPGYYSVLVQSGGNVLPSSSTGVISDVGPSTIHRANSSSTKRTHLSTSAPYSVNQTKATSSQTSSLKGASQISKVNAGTAKRPMSSYNIGSGGSASSHMPQSGSSRSSLQPVGTHLPELNQTKYSYPAGSTLLNIMATANGQTITNENLSKLYNRRAFNDSNSNVDPLSEKNRGPRSSKSRNQITVKAYTTKAGNCNSEGNIVISADEYNKDDFPVDYPNAKFFVIKSYSEDDVHKSVKYNVWSSTPNGNRKLNIAYEDAQKIDAGKSRGCPIFLFFSVNASGQFCGVAEMVGPVEFDRDMDFWQQDKWSGSFPVKWHMIKDVSNPTFRHIILENNEHKPVTNSRDTQEILYKPGLEMLKVFKNYTSKTSLLDDFIYYENRQRMMCEERSRFLRRANGHVHAHAFQQPTQLNHVTDRPPKDGVGSWVEKVRATEKTAGATSEKMHSFTVPTEKPCAASNKQTPSEVEPSSLTGHTDKSCAANNNQVPSETGPTSITGQADKSCAASNKQIPLEVRPADDVSTVKMGSLSIYPTVGTPGNNVVTVGSLPIKVDGGMHKPPVTLTIGTIALDPETLQNSKKGFLKAGLEK